MKILGFLERWREQSKGRAQIHGLTLALCIILLFIFILRNVTTFKDPILDFPLFRIYGWPFNPAVIYLDENTFNENLVQFQWDSDVIGFGEYHLSLRFIVLNLTVLGVGLTLLMVSSEWVIRRMQVLIAGHTFIRWVFHPTVCLRTLVILSLVAGGLMYPYVATVQDALNSKGYQAQFSFGEELLLVIAPFIILSLVAYILECHLPSPRPRRPSRRETPPCSGQANQ